MRKILLLLTIIWAGVAHGQAPVKISNPYDFQKWIAVGKYTTAAMPTASGCPRCILFNTDSSNFAFSNGTDWTYLGGGGGGSSSIPWGHITGNLPDQTDLLNRLNLKVNYSDTGSMLSPYLRSILGVKYADTSAMLTAYLRAALGVKYTDTGVMLAPYLKSVNFNKVALGLDNVINFRQVVNKGGMDSMQVVDSFSHIPAAGVGPTLIYAQDSNALYFNNRSAYVKISGGSGGGGGGTADSSIFLTRFRASVTYVPLSNYTQHAIDSLIGFIPYNSSNPSNFISGNQNITLTPAGDIKGAASGSTAINPTDTVIGLLTKVLPSLATGNLRYNGSAWIFDNTHYLIGADTVNLSALIAARVKYSDTAGMLSPYLRSAVAAATYLTTASIAGKLNISDTAAMLTAYQRAATAMKYSDTASMLTPYQRAALAMKYTDTATMLSPYLRSTVAAATYATITNLALKVNISDTATMLSPYLRSALATATYATITNLALKKNNSDSANLTNGYTSRARAQQLIDSLSAVLVARGVTRIGLLDSLARVAQGGQVIGNNLYLQTVDFNNPGLATSLMAKIVDSLDRGLIKSKVILSHVGAGTWSGYTSLLGDSLYLKNWQVASGFLLAAQTDSSLKLSPDFTVLAGLTNTQTFTNKTLTSPVLNLGSDATGDMYYRNSSGLLTRLVAGSNGQEIRLAGGVPIWHDTTTGGGGGSQTLSQVLTALADTIKISSGNNIVVPGYNHSTAGLVTAALGTRLDSLVRVFNSGHGRALLRAPYTMDSLIARGVSVTASSGLSATYTGNNDSVAFNIAFTALTTNGDMLIYNNGPARVGPGSNGQVWTMVGGLPGWATTAGTGTVTAFAMTPTVGTLFTQTLSNPNTTPSVVTALAAAPAAAVWGSVAGGAPGYFTPSLISSLFANQGTSNTVLRGNAAGNQSYGPVDMGTMMTGTQLAAQEPAHTGDVSNTAGSLNLVIGANKVTDAMLVAMAASKLTGVVSPDKGGSGINNGSNTLTLGANFATIGNGNLTFRESATADLTLPNGTHSLLASDGSGAGLSNVVTSITGTANQIIVNQATGGVTISGPQSLAPTNAPTFTGLSLTGLGGGALGDNILTIAAGVVRSSSLATLGYAFGQYTPSWTSVNNVTGTPTAHIVRYTKSGNTVTLWGRVDATSTALNALTILDFAPPIATTFASADDCYGSGTYGNAGPGTAKENFPVTIYANTSTNKIEISVYNLPTVGFDSSNPNVPFYFSCSYLIN